MTATSLAHRKDLPDSLQELLFGNTGENGLKGYVQTLRQEFGQYSWVGVIDIDKLSAFTNIDKEFLEKAAAQLTIRLERLTTVEGSCLQRVG